MSYPHLTFFCELEAQPLRELFSADVIAELKAIHAGVSLAMVDYTPERAEVVRCLNQEGIPVTAWLLLPREQGYWFNLNNAAEAVKVYPRFKSWSQAHGLRWERIGLDIEPDILEMSKLRGELLRLTPILLKRLMNRRVLWRAQQIYRNLVSTIQRDGYPVESYIFPFISDERKATSDILRRMTGLVDLAVDREVWMLYTSFIRPHGAGVLQSYAPEAQAIALGSTGGGVENLVGDERTLSWDEMGRDLRLAWYWCNNLYIFSLEGCVQNGMLPKFKDFAWDYPILLPDGPAEQVNNWRSLLQALLWTGSNLPKLILGSAFGFVVFKQFQRKLFGRKHASGEM